MAVIKINRKKNFLKVKLPRFMLCENPIEKSGEFILHNEEPKMLIQVLELTYFSIEERDQILKNVKVGSSIEIDNELYYFIPIHIYSEIKKKSVIELNNILINVMTDCADWFEEYIIWIENQMNNV